METGKGLLMGRLMNEGETIRIDVIDLQAEKRKISAPSRKPPAFVWDVMTGPGGELVSLTRKTFRRVLDYKSAGAIYVEVTRIGEPGTLHTKFSFVGYSSAGYEVHAAPGPMEHDG